MLQYISVTMYTITVQKLTCSSMHLISYAWLTEISLIRMYLCMVVSSACFLIVLAGQASHFSMVCSCGANVDVLYSA